MNPVEKTLGFTYVVTGRTGPFDGDDITVILTAKNWKAAKEQFREHLCHLDHMEEGDWRDFLPTFQVKIALAIQIPYGQYKIVVDGGEKWSRAWR
jgi:hypothetical protein